MLMTIGLYILIYMLMTIGLYILITYTYDFSMAPAPA